MGSLVHTVSRGSSATPQPASRGPHSAGRHPVLVLTAAAQGAWTCVRPPEASAPSWGAVASATFDGRSCKGCRQNQTCTVRAGRGLKLPLSPRSGSLALLFGRPRLCGRTSPARSKISERSPKMPEARLGHHHMRSDFFALVKIDLSDKRHHCHHRGRHALAEQRSLYAVAGFSLLYCPVGEHATVWGSCPFIVICLTLYLTR